MTKYEKNLAVIKKYRPDLLETIELHKMESKEDISFEKAENGEFYPVLTYNQEEWRLNSKYNPAKAADIFAEQCGDIKEFTMLFIFGFGDGRFIKATLEQLDESIIVVVYEPSGKLFAAMLEQYDFSEIVKKKNLLLMVEQENILQAYFETIINYNNLRMLKTLSLPAYDIVFAEQYKHMLEHMIYFMKRTRSYRATIYNFRSEFAGHAINTMYDYLWQTDTYQLKKQLAAIDLKKIPAIIVAAGPSLNKNVHELKRAKGKALILVVDAALRAVINAGVKPDLGMTIDARVPDRFFEGVDISEFPFIFENISKEKLVNEHTGKHFYDEFPCELFRQAAMKERGYQLDVIESGGSISTSAYSLVKALGFKKIVFIGQDLAFTGGLTYNTALSEGKAKDRKYQESRTLVEVRGYDGTVLKTDYQMDMYRRWIENEILKLPPDIEVIDATEGGAIIEGAKIQTLKEVIDSCTEEVDFEKLLREVPLEFSDEERKHIIQRIKREPKRLEKIKEYIKEAAEVVEQLKKADAGKEIEEEKRLLKEFNKLNKRIQREPVQDLLFYYNSAVEFNLGDDILSSDLSVEDLCNRAKIWYQGLEESINCLIKDLHEKFIDRL